MNAATAVQTHAKPEKSWVLWVSYLLSLWPTFVIVTSGYWKLTRNAPYVAEFTRIGWPTTELPLLACLQLGSLVLYLIPRTAILGAILLTGYLGGAVASYVRIQDPLPLLVPLSTSMIAWAGIYLRDERLRSLLPIRRG